MAEKVELNNKYLFLSDVTFLANFYLCIVYIQILLQRQIKYTYGYINSIPVTSCLENYLNVYCFLVAIL